MKTLFKKGTSLVMAMIMCISVFAGFATTAYAAGEQAEIYMIAFPRDGDANWSTSWGHGNLHYMNGWYSGSSTYMFVRAMGSYTGNICYCIEPGTPQNTGDWFTAKDETFWDNYPSSYNYTIGGDEVKLFIGRILQYGYCGEISTSWRSQNPSDAAALAHATATQYLIWETVIGERDSDFNHVTPVGYDAVVDQLSTANPLYSQIMSYYHSMETSVQNHTKVPSFMKKSTGKAQTFEMTWNGSEYTLTLTDTNNVLGNYRFSSSQSDMKFTVSGNKLTISSKTAPSATLTISATKTNGARKGLITWTDGRYGPGQGIQDIVTYAQEVSDPVSGYLKLKVSYGACKIVKTSEDGIVSGLSFTISGNGVNQTVTTNAKGEFTINNLMPGVYTVTEQTYDRYEPQEAHRVTVLAGQTASVQFNNTLKRGNLSVVKSAEDNLLEGIKFHLYGTALNGAAIDEYAVTDANGKATFKDVLISGTTPYTIEEIDTAVRYVVPADQTAPVKWQEVTTRSFSNILKKFTVTVTKSDGETGTAQGDASLAGACYGLYKGNQLVASYFTDENGQFTSGEFVCGDDWSIREISPSEGYLLDSASYHVGAEAVNYLIEHNQTSVDVTEQVMKGNVAIIKHTDNGDTQIETPEAGAVFQIYHKADGSFDAAPDSERDTLTCDENGFAQSKNMPYGTYTIHQVSGWEGRELMSDFDAFISADGQTYRYLINNANFESYLKIVKVDAETGKTIPYAGAGFQIYDPEGNLVSMTFTYPSVTTIDTFYTDANGSLITPEKLPYGDGYSIVEVQAPYGYVLNSNPVSFNVREDASGEEGGVNVIEVIKENTAQKGIISVEKLGEVFSDVVTSGGENQPSIYQPQYAVQGLAGAKYEICAAEDIVTLDGTVRYSAGEVVDTITTGENGVNSSKPLYLGKYEVHEVEAPFGMVLNSAVHTVELVYAGQTVEITETATSFVNERQKVSVSLTKVMEQNELFHMGYGDEISNVTFGLFAAEDIPAANGTVIPADGLIEILTVDANGTASANTDLPFGSYYVQELETDQAYLLDGTKYPVVFAYEGQNVERIEIAVNDAIDIANKLLYGSVSGMKVDENGDGLAGALIGLFASADGPFTEDAALMTTISAEDGSFSFEKLPYGIWYVREIAPPEKYVLNDTVYAVTISENEQVVELSITNTLIRGNITLTKVDKDYPDNKLTGAAFAVYEDTNGNGKLDKDDALLGELEETEVGIYTMNDLVYGRYFVKETVAPEGFKPDEGIYTVEITEDGKTYAVENEAGVGFINTARVGSMKIVKTSSDGKVDGFSFRITGPNSFDQTFVTDKKGEIRIDGLRIGEYLVTEVSDTASSGYILPDSKLCVVFEGSVTTVSMHNELRDTPKTGDDSNVLPWMLLAGASAAGAVTFGVLGFKKRRKEEDN